MFRPLLMAAAAAGLLASGCDYWRNLVGEKIVTVANLRVKVLDAYTLDPLLAVCTDTNRGLELQTSLGNGQVGIPNAGTGMYAIHCKSTSYYDKTISFPLTPASDTVIFELARLGGEAEWYMDHPTRDVRIRERFDTLRFPGAFDFTAYPEDTTRLHRFRYEWTFSKAKGLDQTTGSENSKYPTFHREPDSENTAPGPDTLTLRVWSLLNDPKTPYYIGMDKRAFVWKLNRRPKLVMDTLDPGRLYPVGCPSIYQPLEFEFHGEDPDGNGTCKSVHFFTDGTASSFGHVDTTLTCYKQSITFHLRNTLDSLRSDSAVVLPNILNATVTDDKGARFDTTIEIKTRTNVMPTVTSSIEGNPTSVFTDDSVKVKFEVSDVDGIPRWAVIKWSGEVDPTVMDYRSKSENSIRDSTVRIFPTPGPQSIWVRGIDICGETVNSFTGDILIRKNRDPEAELKYFSEEGAKDNRVYVFKLKVTDPDIHDALADSITEVHVNWNEGVPEKYFPNIRSSYDKELRHQFTRPPDSLGRYRIIVSVLDAHQGIGLDTLFMVP